MRWVLAIAVLVVVAVLPGLLLHTLGHEGRERPAKTTTAHARR